MQVLWVDILREMSITRTERHHLLPRSRGGGNGDNLIVLTKRGHASFHTLFAYKTFLEAIAELKKWHVTRGVYEDDFTQTELFKVAYENVFGDRDFLEAIDFLKEVYARHIAGKEKKA